MGGIVLSLNGFPEEKKNKISYKILSSPAKFKKLYICGFWILFGNGVSIYLADIFEVPTSFIVMYFLGPKFSYKCDKPKKVKHLNNSIKTQDFVWQFDRDTNK